MIIELDYDTKKHKDVIKMKCDYCNSDFLRKKREVVKSRINIGKDCCPNRDCINLKSKDVNIFKYGVSNPMKSNSIKNKQKKTLFENYGVDVPAKSNEIKERMYKTNIEKYGTACTLQNEEIKQKTIQTWKENHNCEHPFASPDIQNKIKQTMLDKYGKHYTKTQDYLDKSIKTNQERYGHNHSSQSEETKLKKKKTNQERYNCDYPSQNEEILKKIFSLGNQRKNYGKTEDEIKSYLNEISDSKFQKTMIEKKELDIFCKDLNLAVEYCGLYWHNEKSPEPRDRSYHFGKYNMCLRHNIRLITIFEDEWIEKREQCKNYLNSVVKKFETRIFARKCKIQEVDNKHSNLFYEKYHLLGAARNTIKSFGIFYENELIGVISLGRHHRNNTSKRIMTINRLCFKANVQIIGGSSKIFSACLKWCKENNIEKIITWSDNRWSDGNVYNNLGFELEAKLKPDYSYVDLKKKYHRVSKQSQKKSNCKRPDGITESQWCLENKLVKIWDCGKKRWVFNVRHCNGQT